MVQIFSVSSQLFSCGNKLLLLSRYQTEQERETCGRFHMTLYILNSKLFKGAHKTFKIFLGRKEIRSYFSNTGALCNEKSINYRFTEGPYCTQIVHCANTIRPARHRERASVSPTSNNILPNRAQGRIYTNFQTCENVGI